MSASGILWNQLNKIKPALKWLLPDTVRRRGKSFLDRRTISQISQVQLEPWDQDAYPDGINLIGPIDCATGLGQSFRLLTDVIDAAGLPYVIYNCEQHTDLRVDVSRYQEKMRDMRQIEFVAEDHGRDLRKKKAEQKKAGQRTVEKTADNKTAGKKAEPTHKTVSEKADPTNKTVGKIADPFYGISLWHVNPSDLAEAYDSFGKDAFDGHYNIAFWLWELEDFPDEWVPYMRLFQEIWTPSEFISNAIRKKSSPPVYTVPYHVTAPADTEKYGRAYFGLPEDQFLFLMMYDALSISERKNPQGMIQAFRMAFAPDDERVGLVIKINSADEKELDQLRESLAPCKNIYFVNRNLEKLQVNSLIADTNAFLSLHRAEGFGLGLAEAMLNRVPVIATNWSANTEFMNADTACMVGFQMQTLEKDIPPYKKGSRWADPDIEEAAGFMKRLADDREYCRRIADSGYRYVSEHLGMERVQGIIRERLEKVKLTTV